MSFLKPTAASASRAKAVQDSKKASVSPSTRSRHVSPSSSARNSAKLHTADSEFDLRCERAIERAKALLERTDKVLEGRASATPLRPVAPADDTPVPLAAPQNTPVPLPREDTHRSGSEVVWAESPKPVIRATSSPKPSLFQRVRASLQRLSSASPARSTPAPQPLSSEQISAILTPARSPNPKSIRFSGEHATTASAASTPPPPPPPPSAVKAAYESATKQKKAISKSRSKSRSSATKRASQPSAKSRSRSTAKRSSTSPAASERSAEVSTARSPSRAAAPLSPKKSARLSKSSTRKSVSPAKRAPRSPAKKSKLSVSKRSSVAATPQTLSPQVEDIPEFVRAHTVKQATHAILKDTMLTFLRENGVQGISDDMTKKDLMREIRSMVTSSQEE